MYDMTWYEGWSNLRCQTLLITFKDTEWDLFIINDCSLDLQSGLIPPTALFSMWRSLSRLPVATTSLVTWSARYKNYEKTQYLYLYVWLGHSQIEGWILKSGVYRTLYMVKFGLRHIDPKWVIGLVISSGKVIGLFCFSLINATNRSRLWHMAEVALISTTHRLLVLQCNLKE